MHTALTCGACPAQNPPQTSALSVQQKEGDPQFQLHLKPNQQLKCPNADSIHNKACFKAIPSGVCKGLSELSNNNTETNNNRDIPLDKTHQCHPVGVPKKELKF